MIKDLILLLASTISKEDLVEKVSEAITVFNNAVTPEEKDKAWRYI